MQSFVAVIAVVGGAVAATQSLVALLEPARMAQDLTADLDLRQKAETAGHRADLLDGGIAARLEMMAAEREHPPTNSRAAIATALASCLGLPVYFLVESPEDTAFAHVGVGLVLVAAWALTRARLADLTRRVESLRRRGIRANAYLARSVRECWVWILASGLGLIALFIVGGASGMAAGSLGWGPVGLIGAGVTCWWMSRDRKRVRESGFPPTVEDSTLPPASRVT